MLAVVFTSSLQIKSAAVGECMKQEACGYSLSFLLLVLTACEDGGSNFTLYRSLCIEGVPWRACYHKDPCSWKKKFVACDIFGNVSGTRAHPRKNQNIARCRLIILLEGFVCCTRLIDESGSGQPMQTSKSHDPKSSTDGLSASDCEVDDFVCISSLGSADSDLVQAVVVRHISYMISMNRTAPHLFHFECN